MMTLDESAARRARRGARTIAGHVGRHGKRETLRQGTPRVRALPYHHLTTPPSSPPRLTILTLISLIYTPTFVIRDRPYIHLRIHPPLFDSTLDSQFCPFFSYRTRHFL